MKIALAATGPDPSADLSAHAARAPYYLVYSEDGTFVGGIANPAAELVRGAAPTAARFLFDQGVDMLVAGDFRSKFISELNAHGIDDVQSGGSIARVLNTVVRRVKL